jgi:hypothetical protein
MDFIAQKAESAMLFGGFAGGAPRIGNERLQPAVGQCATQVSNNEQHIVLRMRLRILSRQTRQIRQRDEFEVGRTCQL